MTRYERIDFPFTVLNPKSDGWEKWLGVRNIATGLKEK